MRFQVNSLLAVGLCLAGATTTTSRAEDPLAPFPPGSRWSTENVNGGMVTAAGRAGDAIELEGTGSGLSGDGGKGVLWHQTGDQFSRTITARLVSLEGADGAAEAGIWLHQKDQQFRSVGMRLIYRPDRTLRWEAAIYTEPPSSGGPVSGLGLPLWLRVKFYQGGLQGYYSPNGTDWSALSAEVLPITMPPDALPALLVSSQGQPVPAKARFDNVAIVDGDADENGILDGWEIENFQHLLGPDASEDADRDGSTNAEEWFWGAQPRVADRKPALGIESIGDGKVRVTLSVAVQQFSRNIPFETSPSLSGPWTVAPADPGLPFGKLTLTVPIEATAQFFRAVPTGSPYEDPSPGGSGF